MFGLKMINFELGRWCILFREHTLHVSIVKAEGIFARDCNRFGFSFDFLSSCFISQHDLAPTKLCKKSFYSFKRKDLTYSYLFLMCLGTLWARNPVALSTMWSSTSFFCLSISRSRRWRMFRTLTLSLFSNSNGLGTVMKYSSSLDLNCAPKFLFARNYFLSIYCFASSAEQPIIFATFLYRLFSLSAFLSKPSLSSESISYFAERSFCLRLSLRLLVRNFGRPFREKKSRISSYVWNTSHSSGILRMTSSMVSISRSMYFLSRTNLSKKTRMLWYSTYFKYSLLWHEHIVKFVCLHFLNKIICVHIVLGVLRQQRDGRL